MANQKLQKLRNQGHRITQARSAIINLLENTDHPLTVSSIHSILAKIGTTVNITTVYRELDFLLEKHIVEKVPLVDNELHYEITGRDHHHHLFCTGCGGIQDIELESEKYLLEEAHGVSAYAIKRHSLTFYGQCPGCQ